MANRRIYMIKKRWFVAFVLLFSMLVRGQSVIVNSTNYKQTIDMIGGDMERSSKAIQNANNKAEILDWSFADIGFNICRVQYDKNQEMVEGTKNWAFYDKQVATMRAIKVINPDIKFFATMRSDYDGFGDDNNMPDWIHTYNSKATNVVKYGLFLADYCEYMSQQGVPISILSTAKEWMWHVRAYEADDIINTLNSELDIRGIEKPIIIDQGFWSLSAGITYLNDVASIGTKDLYQGFCSHNYSNLGPEKWVEIIEKSVALGKPMYDDETSTGSGSPTYGEERAMYKQIDEYIKKAERYAAGLSGEIFFEIWSRGIDKETRSIYYPASGTGRRLRGYYMMKQFSNNILNHRYLTSSINSLPNVHTITFRKENKIVLWVINEGDAEYTIPIQMDQSTITSLVTSHYWTNNTAIEGAKNTYIASGNTFQTTVEGESMNCYIFNVTDDVVDACNLEPSTLIEAECYDDMLGVQTEPSSEGTQNVSVINNGDWIKFEDVDLGSGATQFSARVASNTSGGMIELRTGSETGTLIGTLAVHHTSGWQNYKTVRTTIRELTGIQQIYLVFSGATGTLFNLNWFKLEAAPAAINLNAETGNASVTLNWSLENIESDNQKIYRNTYLSETGRTLIAEDVTGVSYTDQTISNGQTYWYWVEALDASSRVVNSNPVEVMATIPNLALASNGGIATQSVTGYGGLAERAIDGNTDGNFNNNSVSHTENGVNGSGILKWWQVDLQADYDIETITIFNRTGSNYSERLNNFTVEVKDSNGHVTFSQFYAAYPNPSLSIDTEGVVGRVVRISKTSDNGITLAEVQVFGVETVLSTQAFDKKSNLKIYPNPTSDDFTITNSKGALVSIYNVFGRLVLETKIQSHSQRIAINTFNNGVYFVNINNNGVIINKKIIKK